MAKGLEGEQIKIGLGPNQETRTSIRVFLVTLFFITNGGSSGKSELGHSVNDFTVSEARSNKSRVDKGEVWSECVAIFVVVCFLSSGVKAKLQPRREEKGDASLDFEGGRGEGQTIET